jgi:hypothetical protein
VNHAPTDTTTELTATFSTDVTGLPDAVRPDVVALDNGATYELRIAPVAKTLGDDRVRMLSYNGSIPGPTLRVRQGSEVIVHVRNEGDTEATVHWHGLRLDNAYDGVPFETQPPINIGGEFTYRLRFPDPGLYWYHPHIREDYGTRTRSARGRASFRTAYTCPMHPDFVSTEPGTCPQQRSLLRRRREAAYVT